MIEITSKDFKELNPEELQQIKNICEKIERQEYNYGGWKKLNGGFAQCDIYDYDYECIDLELKYGIIDEGEKRVYTETIIVDRKNMTYEW